MGQLELVHNVLRSELETCENKIDLWRTDHKSAMLYFDVCDLVKEINDLFDSLTKLDDNFRASFYNDPATFDELTEAKIGNLFQRWTILARELVGQLVSWAEKDYEKIDGTDLLRQRVKEAMGITADPCEFFQDDKLVELRDEAIDEHLNGQGTHA